MNPTLVDGLTGQHVSKALRRLNMALTSPLRNRPERKIAADKPKPENKGTSDAQKVELSQWSSSTLGVVRPPILPRLTNYKQISPAPLL